jgi:hypothetical protein
LLPCCYEYCYHLVINIDAIFVLTIAVIYCCHLVLIIPFSLCYIAGVLEPAGHYGYNFGKDLSCVKALTTALKKITSPAEFMKLIPEIDMYNNFRGLFGSLYPESASTRVSSTQWWITFRDSTPLLQKYAIRIVPQCTSSSGCERN